MASSADHVSRIDASPWAGVYLASVRSKRSFSRHWHDGYGIGRIERGAHRSASGRGEVDAYVGNLVATNPGEVHDGRPVAGAPRQWHTLYFDGATLAAMLGERAQQALIHRPVIDDTALAARLAQLLGCMAAWNRRGRTQADAMPCEEALAQLLGTLFEHHGSMRATAGASPAMAAVRERLGSALTSTPSLAELAMDTGLSRYQVLRQFSKAYGMTPHAWLLRLRAERARGLIRGGVGLADAAAATGFADQSHMTRVFTACFGFTPGAWQRAMCNHVQDG